MKFEMKKYEPARNYELQFRPGAATFLVAVGIVACALVYHAENAKNEAKQVGRTISLLQGASVNEDLKRSPYELPKFESFTVTKADSSDRGLPGVALKVYRAINSDGTQNTGYADVLCATDGDYEAIRALEDYNGNGTVLINEKLPAFEHGSACEELEYRLAANREWELNAHQGKYEKRLLSEEFPPSFPYMSDGTLYVKR